MKTGYFFVASKSFGLIIQAFNLCPFSVVNSKNSLDGKSYFANFVSKASLDTMVLINLPDFVSCNVCFGAILALEYELMKYWKFGLNVALFVPVCAVKRVLALPFNLTL